MAEKLFGRERSKNEMIEAERVNLIYPYTIRAQTKITGQNVYVVICLILTYILRVCIWKR